MTRLILVLAVFLVSVFVSSAALADQQSGPKTMIPHREPASVIVVPDEHEIRTFGDCVDKPGTDICDPYRPNRARHAVVAGEPKTYMECLERGDAAVACRYLPGSPVYSKRPKKS